MSLAVSQGEPGSRLKIAVVLSLFVNVVAWSAAASLIHERIFRAPVPIELRRFVRNKDNKLVEKKVEKKEVQKKVEKLRKEPPKPRQRVKPPPPPTHTRVIAAPVKSGPSKPDFTAQEGGQNTAGKVVEQQGPATTPPPVTQPTPPPTPPVTQPTPPPAPPVTQPTAPPAPPVDTKPTPPPEPPKPKGPTKDAESTNMVEPEIPDEVKNQTFKSFVRVKVTVAADGSFDVILRTSSGNQEVDKRVLEALKKWKWKPALKDGEPVESVKLFKFEFEVK